MCLILFFGTKPSLFWSQNYFFYEHHGYNKLLIIGYKTDTIGFQYIECVSFGTTSFN